MTYTEMFCDLGIFGALIFAVVVGALVLMAVAYGVICVLAWIEDEALRFLSACRRRARMRARAAENRARMDGKKPAIREGRKERRCGGYTSSDAYGATFPRGGRQTEVRR